MNRLKGILYTIIGWLACLGWRRSAATKRILIVRIDEIGDYMLWRPFLHEIITADQYRGYEFHFCGNKSWKSLFDTFDADIITQSFWMDKIRFKKEMSYRYRFLRNCYQQHYAVVINPTFSRDKRYDDSIVKATRAAEKIGMKANTESIQPYELGYDAHLYTRLFDHPEKPLFEFIRNRMFTEFVTGQPSQIGNIKIDSKRLPTISFTIPEKYFVVFPGSRSATRIWPAENFARVAQYLFEQYGWTAIVAGTKTDALYIDAFCNQYPNPVSNLAGKTSLPEMLSLLKNAQCLVSVDTGSVHLAAAVGCTVFGIFNGSQYKRFAPYPKEIAGNIYPIYPDDVELELQNNNLVKQKYEFVVRVPYASVKAEKVILAIYQHFAQ